MLASELPARPRSLSATETGELLNADLAQLADDPDGTWTHRISAKYLRGVGAGAKAAARSGVPRTVIRLVPTGFVAMASV